MLRQSLSKLSSLDRVRICGRRLRAGATGLEVRLSEDGIAGVHGTQTCGSPWACPVCSAKIEGAKADELVEVISGAIARGWVVAFGTMTVRHHLHHRLAELLDVQTSAWQAAADGRAWAQDCDRYGVDLGGGRRRIGYVRRVEVTVGPRHGWHPHTHPLLFFGPGTTDDQVREVWDGMVGRFIRRVERAGIDAPTPQQQTFRVLRRDANVSEAVAAYMSKGLALEMTSSSTKTGRAVDSTTPLGLLERFLEDGEAGDLRLWHEYEQATHGRRTMTWAKGLRRTLLGDEAEKTDEELAAAEVGTVEDTVVTIWGPDAGRVLGNDHLQLALIEVTERDGPAALVELLRAAGVTCHLTPYGAAWRPPPAAT